MTLQRLLEFSGNHIELVAALVAILALLAWSFVRDRLQGFKGADPQEATRLINHEEAVVLDTREEGEYKQGHILNSVHVPLSRFDDSLAKLEKYRDRPVIVGCRTGSRSSAACAKLRKHGFGQVYNLQGGILAWQSANLPLTKA